MHMAMMDVGVVRMRMRQPNVLMRMRVGPVAVRFEVVRVAMMGIMRVLVRVAHRLVSVRVSMVLRDVQPDASQHQYRRDPNNGPGVPANNSKDRAAPKNGAIEKYAPVRAVPRLRRAPTNSTRLSP